MNEAKAPKSFFSSSLDTAKNYIAQNCNRGLSFTRATFGMVGGKGLQLWRDMCAVSDFCISVYQFVKVCCTNMVNTIMLCGCIGVILAVVAHVRFVGAMFSATRDALALCMIVYLGWIALRYCKNACDAHQSKAPLQVQNLLRNDS